MHKSLYSRIHWSDKPVQTKSGCLVYHTKYFWERTQKQKKKKPAGIKFKLLSVYIQLVLCKLNLTFYAIFLNGLNIEDYF